MGAGSHTFLLSNGQKIEVYTNSSIVGAPLHCSVSGTVTVTSPYIFTVDSVCSVVDFWVVTSTSGNIEIFADGKRSGKRYPIDQRFLITQANRANWIPRISFRPGVQYTLIPVVATS